MCDVFDLLQICCLHSDRHVVEIRCMSLKLGSLNGSTVSPEQTSLRLHRHGCMIAVVLGRVYMCWDGVSINKSG